MQNARCSHARSDLCSADLPSLPLSAKSFMTVEVRSNLYALLSHLRRTKYKSMFWIDAICIYSDRTAMKHLGILRFMPQLSEGFDFVSERK